MQYLYHLCCVIVPCLIFQIIVLYRIDDELRRRLETKLITNITKFRLD